MAPTASLHGLLWCRSRLTAYLPQKDAVRCRWQGVSEGRESATDPAVAAAAAAAMSGSGNSRTAVAGFTAAAHCSPCVSAADPDVRGGTVADRPPARRANGLAGRSRMHEPAHAGKRGLALPGAGSRWWVVPAQSTGSHGGGATGACEPAPRFPPAAGTARQPPDGPRAAGAGQSGAGFAGCLQATVAGNGPRGDCVTLGSGHRQRSSSNVNCFYFSPLSVPRGELFAPPGVHAVGISGYRQAGQPGMCG
jgi:hypothetical protein